MDGMERWAGLSDHDLILITVTKLEGLDKKVGESLEKLCAQNKELKTDSITIQKDVDGLDNRITSIEATKVWTLWAIGGVAGACVALVIMLGEHILGGG